MLKHVLVHPPAADAAAVDPGNAVCLCHRGRALLMMHQHAAARADLTMALGILQEGNGGNTAGTGHVAHMELNGSYWQRRIQGLLASMPS